jgi:hypothetical protein
MVRYLSLGAPNRLFLEFSSDLSSASSLAAICHEYNLGDDAIH